MLKLSKKLFWIFGIWFMFNLYACSIEINETTTSTTEVAGTSETETTSTTESTTEISVTTQTEITTSTTQETAIIELCVEQMTSDKYSYQLVITTVGVDETTTFLWEFAKEGDISAFSMVDESENSRLTVLYMTEYKYLITEDSETKSAIKYVLDENSDDFEPSIGYFTEFGDDFIFVEKTENVLIEDINTTCYEYMYQNNSYKYYLTNDDKIIRIEYEDEEMGFTTVDINNFESNDIDTSLFTEPTEEDGYEIIDLTNIS